MSFALGAHPVANGTQFAVRARDAEWVTLCLFDDDKERRIAMRREGDVFVAVAPVGPGQRYGFRAGGSWAPDQGLFFDPAKLLVDPYALTLDRRFAYDPSLTVQGGDTASLVPRAVVTAVDRTAVPPPPIFQPGGLIYELNVRGFTLQHPDIPPGQRGTVAALAHPAIIAHLRKLCVNAVELMPITAWIDERHLPPLGLHNAWGYNPVAPMALDPGLVPGGIEELRDTVAALRAAGIGVILDLVFNHTGESDLAGPILSLRGLDNRCYAHAPDGTLINDTGTGNTLNGADPLVRDMILESLCHFAQLGVDGFRFDLAPVMARGPGFDPKAPIFAEIASDPLLKDRILIAEPWDVGPGGYQLGNFPAGWLEWNDRYRDDVRRFWRGDGNTTGTLATRLCGSSDIFSGSQTRSVNFIAAHDGFTLADMVAYAVKHNEANGENNRDGHDENFSWNNGAEGPSQDAGVLARRDADRRALLATLFASRGTILLTAGDEFARTQQGNNNAYAQDNEITWIEWISRDHALEDYVAELAAFRAENPPVGAIDFLTKAGWFNLDGAPMTTEAWENSALPGFELRIPAGEHALVIRIDRQSRTCTTRRAPSGPASPDISG